jgi:hypothetical protein
VAFGRLSFHRRLSNHCSLQHQSPRSITRRHPRGHRPRPQCFRRHLAVMRVADWISMLPTDEITALAEPDPMDFPSEDCDRVDLTNTTIRSAAAVKIPPWMARLHSRVPMPAPVMPLTLKRHRRSPQTATLTNHHSPPTQPRCSVCHHGNHQAVEHRVAAVLAAGADAQAEATNTSTCESAARSGFNPQESKARSIGALAELLN